MKRFIFTIAISVATLFTSCSDNKDYYDDSSVLYAALATVSDLSTDEDLLFELDDDALLFVSQNTTTYEGEAGDRAVIYFNLEETDVEIDEETKADYVKLISVEEVLLGSYAKIETDEESAAITDQYLSGLSSQMSLNPKYLNVYVTFWTKDLENASFSLVENNATTPAETADGYLNLELRFDSAGEELKGKEYSRYLSFDISQFADSMEDMDGIMLRYKTTNSGVGYVKVKLNTYDN